jgi:hypothetical protein
MQGLKVWWEVNGIFRWSGLKLAGVKGGLGGLCAFLTQINHLASGSLTRQQAKWTSSNPRAIPWQVPGFCFYYEFFY